ncbi:MAG: hypothetical protein NT177_08230, partial [Chloroflexi bacterium]|nr:hypothetical protein [Chloroflexota bacterium]
TNKTLSWTVVDTPWDGSNGMFIRTLGINSFALGQDSKTFYAADTANNGFYKSTDAGYTWRSATAPALPVWNVVTAPDNANVVLAVTGGAPNGPKNLFFSSDGGGTWQNTVFPGLGAFEYISCLDFSVPYGPNNQSRDIVVGTRITAGAGRLFTLTTTLSGSWAGWSTDQLLDPSFAPASTGVTSVKFSPAYATDQTIAVISCTAVSMWLHLGKHVSATNSTTWNTDYSPYPVNLGIANSGTIIRTDIELPVDYVASDLALRGCFVSVLAQANSAVLFINNNALTYNITPPNQRIYSIVYKGSNASGTLFAGSATTPAGQALATVYRVADPQNYCAGTNTTPSALPWLLSDKYKSPSGGANSGRANALLALSEDEATIYCGTSSEDSTLGGTGWDIGRWPRSKTAIEILDESAFSYSLDDGINWNQIGLINTEITRLSDVAALEKPLDSSLLDNLYLASLNENTTVTYAFDSVWRSTSDPLGRTWERILTWNSAGDDIILRVILGEASSSNNVIVFADRLTNNIAYSASSGDSWSEVVTGTTVKDISLLDASTMYVLDDYNVRKMTQGGAAWQTVKRLNTDLLTTAHTVCNPVKGTSGKELVFVGSEGNSDTGVAWVDFAAFNPQFATLKEMPMQGNVHVATDDLYNSYKNIYAGINTTTNDDGTIYRWTMEGSGGRDSPGTSINWDPLDPPDRGFYAVCMLNSVLYGAWNTDIDPPINSSGADRTLEARVKVPPPPQWDQLVDGLPPPGIPPLVEFTREPTSMHISSNAYNTLWAIDNQDYNFTAKEGCLWQFVDSVAKLGPWPTAPAPGSLIGADPATGRSQQIDFKWRPMRDIFGYDVLIAKDVNFTLLLSQQLHMTPVDDITGAWIVTPAEQNDPSCWIAPGEMEVGRSYYWMVRASRSWTGTPIHSPWSPTMFFSVRPGFMVTSEYMGPKLLAPVDGICSNCMPPMRFSWSPIKNAETYEFTLARDAQLKNVIVQETTSTTGFELKSKLPFSTPYYWQVKAVAPVISDPSPVGTFTLTENITKPQKQPAPKTKPGAVPAPSNFWIWIIIVIVVLLLLLINAYVFISRRRDS